MSELMRGKLEKARLELLDLTARNRLLNAPLEKAAKSARAIRVRDEIATEVYRLLVEDGKTLTFVAGVEKDETGDADEAGLPQPDENEAVDDRGVKARHRDAKLQTSMTSRGLQKRLLQMYYDARTFAEEQGVNILYLALGFLKWVEADDAKAVRYAPLVLVPVNLERQSAAEKFRLRWSGEDADGNLTLAAKIDADFKVKLPAFPDVNGDDFDLQKYFDAVAEVVSGQQGWEVLRDDILLGFFSFAKFLMYRDLDAANWPAGKLDRHPLVAGLMGGASLAQSLAVPEDALLDEHVPVSELGHVVDADSSQTLAIHEARRGANLVIQGPPGTGKSQTISNVIASAVLDGKRVLFVAEKMAALEVVKRRLDAIGLGPICLEMHSNKVQKRAVLDELGRTLQLGKPAGREDTGLHQALASARDGLNRHCGRMHEKLMPGEVSAYESMGVLTRLRNRGLAPMEIALEKPETWSPAERIRRKNLVGQIAAWIAANGLPSQHAWNGVGCAPMLRADADVLLAGVGVTLPLVDDAARVASSSFGLREVETAWRFASFLRANPGLPRDGSVAAGAVWRTRLGEIRELMRRGAEWARTQAEIDAVFVPAAWDQDLREMRHNLAVHGDGALKFLFGSFRQAKNLLASLLRNPGAMPAASAERVALVDRLMAAQKMRGEFAAQDPLGREAFGSLWRGSGSDWALLDRIVTWAGQVPEALEFLRVDADASFGPLDGCRSALQGLAQRLGMDASVLCAADLTGVRSRLQGWLADGEGLSRWTSYHALATEARALGLGAMVELLADGRVAASAALDRFAFAYHTSMLRTMAAKNPELARFDGDTQNRLVEHFAALDSQLLARNREDVVRKHYAGIPRVTLGPLGVVTSEIAKKRRHLPLRQLVKQAGPALQALKPVFLMSPLSVAQFLEPGAIEFDLLVVDEASQIQPVDALGAISRCKQAVVVGDDRQLPPTQFFSRIMGGEDEEAVSVEEESAADLESILGLCRAKGFPERMLRWHYRSRHESLIAVSNHEFYDNRLYIIPSALRSAGGLRFHHMPDAVYEPGAGVNRAEARVVAEAALRHALESPGLSLGIGAFSIRQRDAILEELEKLRRANPAAESFFGGGANVAEPFFVKNLENVQGDERDVIFISVGYGRDANGVFAMRFGALNAAGGERRLNVLISRAKLRCEVFSPITAEDIDPQRARGRGVAALRTFLGYAQRGVLPGDVAGDAQVAKGDRKLVEEIARCVTAAGYQVTHRYGLAGLFVELAVFDPAKPERVLLGIEIDGDEYRSARSARDRDRLRASVLERQGWRLYRVWAADWYQRPEEQSKRLLAALENAKSEAAAVRVETAPPAAAAIEIRREEPAETVADTPAGKPYVEAKIKVPRNLEPHEAPVWQMVEWVREIVQVEGPVHEDEVIARIRQAFGMARAGSRVQQTVRNAISQARLDACGEGFFRIGAAGTDVEVRDRSGVESAGLRKPEMIADIEYDAAIRAVVAALRMASREQVPLHTARMLGFRSTSGVLRSVLEKRVEILLANGSIVERNGMVSIP